MRSKIGSILGLGVLLRVHSPAAQGVNRQQAGQTEPTFDKFSHVPADLRNAPRSGARTGSGRILPFAVLLVVLVILAAGIGGTRTSPGPAGSHTSEAVPRRPTGPPRKVRNAPPTTRRRPGAELRGLCPVGGAFWCSCCRSESCGVAVALVESAPAAGGSRRSRASVQATQLVPVEPEPEAEPEKLLTGIELALSALDEQREPADAVVRAWLGLQETAEESGIVRRASETPTEFTSRILSRAFADDRAVRTLLRLYLRARFGDHPVTADDVAAVRDALAATAGELARR